MDEYLPPSTYAWCQNQLQQLGFDPISSLDNSEAPHRTVYLQLRAALNNHIDEGNISQLALSEKPTGALSWQPSRENIRTEDVQEVSLVGDDMYGDRE
jgi:hypothetical protein